MPLVRRAAGSPDDVPAAKSLDALLADLQNPAQPARWAAARALGGEPSAVPSLCALLRAESDASVREAVFTALIRTADAGAVDGLLPLLASEDVGLRNGAIEALKAMPDAVAERADALLDGPTDVRLFAVQILGALTHPDSPRTLARILEHETDRNVCGAAVNALAECGDRQTVLALERLRERFPDEPFLEFSIRTAVARIANA